MFRIDFNKLTIEKLPNDTTEILGVFDNLENAKSFLVEHIENKIESLKITIKETKNVNIDDVSQLGFF